MIYSADDLLDHNPCWEPQRVHDMVPEPMTISQLLQLPITLGDKIWVATSLGYLDYEYVKDIETEESYDGLERLIESI